MLNWGKFLIYRSQYANYPNRFQWFHLKLRGQKKSLCLSPPESGLNLTHGSPKLNDSKHHVEVSAATKKHAKEERHPHRAQGQFATAPSPWEIWDIKENDRSAKRRPAATESVIHDG